MILDEKLKLQVIKGDHRAQMELYRLCNDLLMRVVCRYKNNEDDQYTLIDNAFIKVVTNLHKYQEQNNFFAWVKKILMNEIINDFHKQKHMKALVDQDAKLDMGKVVGINTIEYIHEDEHLMTMLNSLPNATKNVFNIYAIDGYSHKEISGQLGITVETSKWHVKKARQQLRQMLQKVD